MENLDPINSHEDGFSVAADLPPAADGYAEVTFIIPLSQGLRLSDGTTFVGKWHPSGARLLRVGPFMVPSNVSLPSSKDAEGEVILRFLRNDTEVATIRQCDEVAPFAAKIIRGDDVSPTSFAADYAENKGHSAGTIVEARVTYPCNTASEYSSAIAATEEGLQWALQCLREVTFRYRHVTGELVPIPALEKLPFMVWMNRVLYRFDGSLIEDFGMGLNILDNVFAGPAGVDLDETRTRELMDVRWSVHNDALFQRFNIFAMDARQAKSLNGDYRTAILSCATAAECLFDDILCHLLWWEGLAPEEAVDTLIKPIYRRVDSEFPQRLGGIWLQRKGPVMDWHLKIARYRDRIIHGGYQPSQQEAQEAIDALVALRTFVGRQVVQPRCRKNYKYLPLLLLGRERLKAAGIDPSRTLDWYSSSNDLDERFDRWRVICRRLRLEKSGGKIDPPLDEASIIAVLSKSEVRFYAAEVPTGLVAEIELPALTSHHRDRFREMQGQLSEHTQYKLLDLIDYGKKRRTQVSAWRPVESVFPGFEFMKPMVQ
jgi:hypothetical protein